MGASVKRSGRGGRHRPMGEINVTPFVDVMLVLLIVFMVILFLVCLYMMNIMLKLLKIY